VNLVQYLKRRVLDVLLPDAMTLPWVTFWARKLVQARRPLIIGVTGSVGKSTTTEMIAAVLRQPAARAIVGRVGSARKNMNDDWGLPLTVLAYESWVTLYPPSRLRTIVSLPFRVLRLARRGSDYPDVWVLEYGTHWEGHLHKLSRIAPPGIAVVTTVGPAHLDRLKTLEGVVQEKGAVVRAVPPDGLVVLGDGHEYVGHFARMSQARVVTVPGRGIELARTITRTVCRHLGVPEAAIEAGIAGFSPPQRRLSRLQFDTLTVIDDSINANPLSMRLALDTLASSTQPGQRRVAVLGHMAELGEESVRYHKEIGAYARTRADVVIGLGELGRNYQADHWFESSLACGRHIQSLLQPGDVVLVKGSNSANTEKVVARLRELWQQGAFAAAPNTDAAWAPLAPKPNA
jgi:UDP-N-acetylmuramoyl-tripeptide--D-alanyl-D-alanine ligase